MTKSRYDDETPKHEHEKAAAPKPAPTKPEPAKPTKNDGSYRVIRAITYARPGRPKTGPDSTDEVAHKAGDVVRDLPPEVADEYVKNGDIEPATESD